MLGIRLGERRGPERATVEDFGIEIDIGIGVEVLGVEAFEVGLVGEDERARKMGKEEIEEGEESDEV